MKVTTKGQVTIPQHIRRFLGVAPHSEVEFTIRDGEVLLERVEETSPNQGVSRFRKLLGCKRGGLSTDEWMEATRGD